MATRKATTGANPTDRRSKGASSTRRTTASGSARGAGTGAGGTKRGAPSGGAKGGSKGGGAKRGATGGGAGRATSGDVFEHLRGDLRAVGTAIASELDRALEAARARLKKGGVVDQETMNRVRDELRDTMADVRRRLDDVRERAAETSKRVQSDDRVRAAADFGIGALHAVAASLRHAAERVEQSLDDARTHATGDTVAAGTYACRDCGDTVVLGGQTKRLPACAGCGGGKFSKTA